MIDIKDMQHLVALAQHRHFAKAAAACKISQPAFSMRIRTLEDKLGLEIVRRGNRFLGFTEQGEILVRRSRQILEDTKALEHELHAASGVVSGSVTLGVVPTAVAYATQLCIRLHDEHPGILVKIESMTSLQIEQRFDDATIDAALTYADAGNADGFIADLLYPEDYVLLAPRGMIAGAPGSMTWEEAAELPLSLLSPQMQNRRIHDRIFEAKGVVPNVIVETNGFLSSLIMARSGTAATIIPQVLLEGIGTLDGTIAIPLSDGEAPKKICLVTPERRTPLPAIAQMRRIAMNAT